MPLSPETIEKIAAYRPKLMKYLLRVKRLSPDVAEDVAQEAILHTLRTGNVRLIPVYMQRTAQNILIDRSRRTATGKTNQLADTVLLDRDAELQPIHSSPVPLSNPEAALALKEIFDRADALTDINRQVFYLYLCDGFTTKEISDILGVRLSTVKSRILRMRIEMGIPLRSEQGSHVDISAEPS